MIVARLAPPATAALWLLVSSTAYPSGFTIEQVLGAPFASDMVAAPAGREFAWVSDARGRSNVWLAAASGAAGFTARALTHYGVDDGLAIEDLAFVPHHDALLFVRGGDPDYPDKPAPNPAQITAGVVQTVYLIDFHGREPVKLGEGHAPVASPDGKRILCLHEGKVFSVAPRRGAKSEQLFNTRGKVDSLRFSPDGTRLAFVCNRGDHSFVGVYTFAEQALRWVDASFSLDPAGRPTEPVSRFCASPGGTTRSASSRTAPETPGRSGSPTSPTTVSPRLIARHAAPAVCFTS